MKNGSSYHARIERDPDGYWFADFPEVPGCHTQARTLEALRERMRDALDLFVDDADAADIVEEFRFDAAVLGLIEESRDLRAAATGLQERAARATAAAAEKLVGLGFTLRDAGELLGLSHQRVQQLVRRP